MLELLSEMLTAIPHLTLQRGFVVGGFCRTITYLERPARHRLQGKLYVAEHIAGVTGFVV